MRTPKRYILAASTLALLGPIGCNESDPEQHQINGVERPLWENEPVVGGNPFLVTTKDNGADATLYEHLPDAVGNDDVLDLRSRNAAATVRHNVVALRFERTRPQGSSASTKVTNARLGLYVTTPDSDSFDVDVYGMVSNTAWDETQATYNSMPGLDDADPTSNDRDHTHATTVYVGTIRYTGGTTGRVRLNSNPALVNFLNTHSNVPVTFLLEAQVAPWNKDFNVYFKSNKNSLQADESYPTLRVETAEIGRTDTLSSQFDSVLDPKTGRRVYQLTATEDNSRALYYLRHNQGSVNAVPHLAYHTGTKGAYSLSSINLDDGQVHALVPGNSGHRSTDVVGEYAYYITGVDGAGKCVSSCKIMRAKLDGSSTEVFSELPSTDSAGNALKYRRQVSVNADGTKVLYSRELAADSRRWDLMCAFQQLGGVLRTVPLVSSEGEEWEHFRSASGKTAPFEKEDDKVSHVQFSPADPNRYVVVSHLQYRSCKRLGLGYVGEWKGDPYEVTRSFEHLTDDTSSIPACKAIHDGELVGGGHPYWDHEGRLSFDATNSIKNGMTPEFNVRITNPDTLPPTLETVRLDDGEFQTHFNWGPSESMFVGDGASADRHQDANQGKPFIHRLDYDLERQEMTQTPLADQMGTYFKSGEYEANARYLPEKNLVVWNAFRTLDGAFADWPDKLNWPEKCEPSYLEPDNLNCPEDCEPNCPEDCDTSCPNRPSWLPPQNVFGVSYNDEDVAGWDFSVGTDGWKMRDGRDLEWTDSGNPQASVGADIVGDQGFLSPLMYLPTEDYTGLLIRIRQDAFDAVHFFFKTNDPNTDESFFSSSRRIVLPITPGFSEYQTYYVDFSQHPEWEHSLTQLRVDPEYSDTVGRFNIQMMRFVSVEDPDDLRLLQ